MPKLLMPNALVIAATLILSQATIAADLAPPVPEWTETVREKAMLYELRAAFDVVEPLDIPGLVRADALRYASAGVGSREQGELLDDLLAEGSYYIVSLAYLVSAGGPNWPLDKAASAYETDATARLAALRSQWIAAVAQAKSGDPAAAGEMLAILRSVDEVNAWTEGQTGASGELDHFSDVESFASDAIQAALEAKPAG
jgi:hypothetical protein